MASIPNYSERRAFGRRAANLTGYVYLPGKAGIACTIKDISEGGALLEFPERMTLPLRLRLMREGSGVIADCEVRHARGKEAGVQFLTDAGRQLARDVFKLTVAGTSPPLAPAPKRDIEIAPSRGSELVQRLRVQRQKPQELPVASVISTEVPRDILSAFETALRLPASAAVPLPMAAHRYARASLPLPLPPRPLAAYLLAEHSAYL